jgi:hypothetical protein
MASTAVPSVKSSGSRASARNVANQAKPMKTMTGPSRCSGRWRHATSPLPMYAQPTSSATAADAQVGDGCWSPPTTSAAAPTPAAKARAATETSRLVVEPADGGGWVASTSCTRLSVARPAPSRQPDSRASPDYGQPVARLPPAGWPRPRRRRILIGITRPNGGRP